MSNINKLKDELQTALIHKQMSDLKVLIVASEISPYAKSGGLGDVVGSLPKALKSLGVDVRVVFPKYRSIREQYLKDIKFLDSFTVHLDWRSQAASIYSMKGDVPTYLIENDFYFGRDGFYGYGDDYERFAFFSKASIEFLNYIDFIPDVIHFNDWQTGVGCVYLKDIYSKFLPFSKIKTLYTIHNIQYQGVFGREILRTIGLNDGYCVPSKLEFYGNISLMKAGLTYANAINTVSETYALEIKTPQYGYGLDGVLREQGHKLSGIVNGIDEIVNNPETDKRIVENFSIDNLAAKKRNKQALQEQLHLPVRDVPMISIISRLVDQKGLDLVAVAMEELLGKDIQFVILGTGDGRYEHMFKHMASRAPDKISANIFFSDELAQRIYASSDLFLMPSMFEPCGLGQLFAMRYGTIPIARETGGLADTIQPYNPETKEGNGFLFKDYLASGMMWAVNQAIDAYHTDDFEILVKNAMTSDFSWARSAEKYAKLYLKLKFDLQN